MSTIKYYDDTTDTWEYASRGAPGPEGQQGPKGDQGIQGPPGEKGDKGDDGEPGPKGDEGPQGIQGEKGDTGDQGAPGASGQDGAPGSKGDKGDKGDPGDPATNLVTSVAGKQGEVVLTKADVGLNNVNNTSDASKPVSTAQATAIGAAKERANHTGTQSQSTITNLTSDLAAKQSATVISSNGMGVVVHGSSAGTARPSGFAQITWFGTVSPNNSTNNDIWINTA